MALRSRLLLLAASVVPGSGLAQGALADYQRAEALLPWNVPAKLHGIYVQPNWIGGTDRFWYRVTNGQGAEFVLIDAARNTRSPAFDHARLARSLSALMGETWKANSLPFDSFEPRDGLKRLRVSLKDQPIECDLGSYVCTKLTAPAALRSGEVESPDGRWAAFVRSHDLYLRSLSDGREIRLTDDGVENDGYGEWADSHLLSISAQLAGRVRPARVLWSPDSRRLVSYRVDQREVPAMPFVQWVPPEGYGSRPRVHWARVPFPADEKMATARLVLFELRDDASVRRVDVQADPVPLFYDLIGYRQGWYGQLWWDATGQRLYHIREERGYREVTLLETDARSGASRTVLKETTPTFFLNQYMQLPEGMTASSFQWPSQRDGWQHLYRYDLQGRLIRQVTRGEWRVDRLQHAEQGEGWIYFTAGGREPGLDPYYLQLYRVTSDGSRIERLTPEDQFHDIDFAPSGRYFVDRRSLVNEAPVTVLRRSDGRLVRVLERADIRSLLAQGWQKPERFKAKGRDGVTDIYGTLFRPSKLDATKRYPVLDDIYGGPQAIYAERAFTVGSPQAELGFINVQIDGMGTPGRSKAFQDVSYGKGFAEAGGLEDHIAVLKELAARHPYMDLDRVGIYGHSGGGYASTRALLDHPDFYKVAVSSAGSHDQYLYQLEWGERFIGRPQWNPEAYALQANSGHVGRFKGKLLLAHGDLDDDVPIVNTMQVLDALIKANKDVDLLIVPGANHSTLLDNPYFIRRAWDYFVKNLMGIEPPAGYRIGAPE